MPLPLGLRRARPLAAAALALALAACGGAPDARILKSAPAPLPPRAALERYVLTPDDVHLEADVRAGTSHTLTFHGTTGTMALSPETPEASTFSFVVDLRSATSSWDLVADLAKERFLHVTAFPEARFVSKSARRVDDGYSVYGDFSLHGTTRTIAVPASIGIDACRAKLTCNFTIHRTEFGAVDSGNLEALASDRIEVRVAIDVARKSAPARCKATKP